MAGERTGLRDLAPESWGLTVELVRFRIIAGKEDRAREWIEYFRQHPKDFLGTLAGEQMYVESIFSDISHGRMHLSWFMLQGPGAQSVMDSEDEFDRIHMRFHQECVDQSRPPQRFIPEVLAVPDHLRQLMKPWS